MNSRYYLTLKEKIQLITDSHDSNGLSQRKLAEKYNISLGSVCNIFLKEKKNFYKIMKQIRINTLKENSKLSIQ